MTILPDRPLEHAGLSYCTRRKRYIVSLNDGDTVHRARCNPRRCDHGREMGKYPDARDAQTAMRDLNAKLAEAST